MLFAAYTWAKVSAAIKNLSKDSARPSLGIDTTLPQYRSESGKRYEPEQNQYPVWYFFYGTLTEPARLSELMGLPVERIPPLQKAQISGDVIKRWGGKHNALIDGPPETVVDGWAFHVS